MQIAFAFYNGLAVAMAVFIVAAGLTLVFGILRVLNFAHGAFFMVGAYLTYTLLGGGTSSTWRFIAAAIASGLLVGLIGVAVDFVVLRRLRSASEHIGLIATFALLLIVQGVAKAIWGVDYRSVNPPDALNSVISIGGVFIPVYTLFVIAAGVVTFILLEIVIHRLWIGKMMKSIAHDAWMASVLGYNVPVGFTLTVLFAFALAGMAGGLLLPNQTLSPALGDSYLILAFVVVVIGGLGSVRGAFVAALIIGLVEALGAVLLPQLPGLLVYVAMVLALLLYPNGFAGRRISR